MGAPVRVVLNRRYLIFEDGKPKFVRGDEVTVAEDVSEVPYHVDSSTQFDLDKDGRVDAVVEDYTLTRIMRFSRDPKYQNIIRQDHTTNPTFETAPGHFSAHEDNYADFGKIVARTRKNVDDLKRHIENTRSSAKCSGDDVCFLEKDGDEIAIHFGDALASPYMLPDGSVALKDLSWAFISMPASASIMIYGEEAGQIKRLMTGDASIKPKKPKSR
jgi:hypothetical protein